MWGFLDIDHSRRRAWSGSGLKVLNASKLIEMILLQRKNHNIHSKSKIALFPFKFFGLHESQTIILTAKMEMMMIMDLYAKTFLVQFQPFFSSFWLLSALLSRWSPELKTQNNENCGVIGVSGEAICIFCAKLCAIPPSSPGRL